MKQEPHSHPLWDRHTESVEWFDATDALRRHATVLSIVAVLVGLAGVILAIATVRSSGLPPPVLGLREGRLFAGKVGVYRGLTDEQIQTLAVDLVEHLLTRTEKGTLPALAPFLGEGVAEAVDEDYRVGGAVAHSLGGPLKQAAKTEEKDSEESAVKAGQAFLQEFVVTQPPRLRATNPGLRAYAVRGLLTSRRFASAQTSVVYLVIALEYKGTSRENPSGWRLTRMAATDEGYYFQEEKRAEKEHLFAP